MFTLFTDESPEPGREKVVKKKMFEEEGREWRGRGERWKDTKGIDLLLLAFPQGGTQRGCT